MSFETIFLNMEKNWVKNRLEGLIKAKQKKKTKWNFSLKTDIYNCRIILQVAQFTNERNLKRSLNVKWPETYNDTPAFLNWIVVKYNVRLEDMKNIRVRFIQHSIIIHK